jgi:hypothetical protein
VQTVSAARWTNIGHHRMAVYRVALSCDTVEFRAEQSMAIPPVVEIDVVSDTICPW